MTGTSTGTNTDTSPRTSTAGDGRTWLRRYHPAPEAGVRLVCFPHAGGSATFYFPVSRTLSGPVEVLPVQYPGRQDRHTEPCVGDIGELADHVASELLPLAARPLALFGHSMGALVAYEVARRLEDSGIEPACLFVSGRRAPTCSRDENVHRLNDDGLIEQLRRLSGTEAQILGDPEVLRLILPAVRSDYEAVESYRHEPGPPLRCPVVALTGDDDPQVTFDEAAAWSERTVGGFELNVYEGGHFYLNSQAAAVMETIAQRLRTPSPVGPAGPGR
ncbi:thioesterase II family protein [Streptomyces sp. NPDC102467]|uniref:thioesterase II family protein n=1 Tax=Streptomyces sp. NPDC102467 TaxID=3366179 RepID=UPI0038234363